MGNKKGSSEIIASFIVILIVLVFLTIVWVVVKGLVDDKNQDTNAEGIKLDAKIEKVVLDNFSNNASIKIKGNYGYENLTGLKFIFYAKTQTEEFSVNTYLEELEDRFFVFHLNYLNVSDLTEISVAPILETVSNGEILGNVTDTYNVVASSGGGGGGGSSSSGSSSSGGCVPKTCQNLMASCSSPNNGCGGTLNCGSCASGKTCNSLYQCVPQAQHLTCANIVQMHPGANCVQVIACGTLSQYNTYYLLMNDISSDNDCITIDPSLQSDGSLPPIIFDLNQYMVMFGNVKGQNQNGIYITGNSNRKPNIEIKNGYIRQGAGNGTDCASIRGGYWSPNKNISNINAFAYGVDCKNIDINGGKNITIINNYLEQNVSYVTDRAGKAISQIGVGGQGNIGEGDATLGGYLKIINNTLRGKGQMGITAGRSTAAAWGNYTALGIIQGMEIAYNDISMEGVVANPYAIVINGYESNQYYTPLVHDNYIHQINARGIDIDAIDDLLGMKGGKLYNNYIDTKQGCLIDNLGGDTSRSPSCGTHSLRIRSSDGYYRSGGSLSNPYGENSNNLIYNNTIISRGDELLPSGELSGYGYAVRISVRDFNQSLNMTFENNTIISYTSSTGSNVKSVYIDDVIPGNKLIFKNNKFISNYNPLEVAGSDILFLDNQINKSGTLNSGYRPLTIGYWTFQATGNIFLNQSFVNSPGFDSVVYQGTDGGNLKNITVKWHAKVYVTSGGSPVSGASVVIKDAFSSQEFLGVTDSSGFARTNLTEFKEACNFQGCTPSKTTYTPHNVSVNYNSVNQWRIITMNQSRIENFAF
ncbi:MAG: hypothetical protein AABW50_02835 [Nanoarchaeota archaeon]